MKPAPFLYIRASSVDDALAGLAGRGDDAKILAGGQSLIAMMNLRLIRPAVLIDINRLSDLAYIRQDNGTVAIGALTRQSAVEASEVIARLCPLMAEAIRFVAHRPIRNRGTVGGNLAHADPTSELPAVAVALGATFVVRSQNGQRTIAADNFFVAPLSTALAPSELLTEVRVPVWPAGQGWSFMEVSPRAGDYALVGVAATLRAAGGVCQAARLVYSGVGPRPIRVVKAEQVLVGRPSREATFREVAEIAAEQVDPSSDFHATAEYRRDLVRALTRRALMAALDRGQKGA
jgi:aerobic carbon-monoxide dehydrogenase medium subunit